MSVSRQRTLLDAFIVIGKEWWPGWAFCRNAGHRGRISQSTSRTSLHTLWVCGISSIKVFGNRICGTVWNTLPGSHIFVKIIWTGSLAGTGGLNSKTRIVANRYTGFRSIVLVKRGIHRTVWNTHLSGGILVEVVSHSPRTTGGAVVVSCIPEGVLTGWTLGDALSRKVVCIFVGSWTEIFSNTNPVEGISILSGLRTSFLANVCSCYCAISRDVSEIARWTLSDAGSCWSIPELAIRTLCYTLPRFYRTVLCKEGRRTRAYTASVVKGEGPWWTVFNTGFRDMIDVILSGQAGRNTSSISSYILNVESLGADVHAHFNVGVGVSKKLSRAIAGAVACTCSRERVTILARGAFGSFDTEIGWVEESIVGAFGYTSVFDFRKSLVDKVILRANSCTCSIRVECVLS